VITHGGSRQGRGERHGRDLRDGVVPEEAGEGARRDRAAALGVSHLVGLVGGGLVSGV